MFIANIKEYLNILKLFTYYLNTANNFNMRITEEIVNKITAGGRFYFTLKNSFPLIPTTGILS